MSNPREDVSVIVIVEEAGSLDVRDAELVPAPMLLDSPRVFVLEAVCPQRPRLDRFAVLPAASAQINLRALLGSLFRVGVKSVELVPESSYAYELCTGLSSEKISVRDMPQSSRIDPIHSIAYRAHKALEVRQKLELSNRLEDLRVNQWVSVKRRTSSIALATGLGKHAPEHVEMTKLLRPGPLTDEPPAYLRPVFNELDHPAIALASRAKALFLSSLHAASEDLALTQQHEAATLLFEAYEVVRDGRGPFYRFRDSAIFEQLWMRGWYDSLSASCALEHLEGLWLDAPTYRGQSYALLILQLEDKNSAMIPPFLNYLPKPSTVSKLMARVFDAELFIDSKSQTAGEYIGHEPKNQVVKVFKFLEYIADEKHGKSLRDPPPERVLTKRPSFRTGSYNFVCALKFADRDKAIDVIRGVHRGSAGALENTLLTLLNSTLRDWGGKFELESVKVRPFTYLVEGEWQFRGGWPRLNPQTGLAAI